ncbi:hypothetical protein TNCV_4312501 [Trichonephila clavipes]|nr:hypothetical protein TNCV_4312501 [Trichonephila clavipes]
MAKADSDAPKKPASVFDFIPLPKATQCEQRKKKKKLSSNILTSTPIKEVPNSSVASTSKDVVEKYPASEDEYCDPPTEE